MFVQIRVQVRSYSWLLVLLHLLRASHCDQQVEASFIQGSCWLNVRLEESWALGLIVGPLLITSKEKTQSSAYTRTISKDSWEDRKPWKGKNYKHTVTKKSTEVLLEGCRNSQWMTCSHVVGNNMKSSNLGCWSDLAASGKHRVWKWPAQYLTCDNQTGFHILSQTLYPWFPPCKGISNRCKSSKEKDALVKWPTFFALG